ncbi:MAG TPA: methyltransferase domain-containing protein [Kofleriaceae bacterium]|nr:methyltransferase domain-containing protein [Kofleriaceae bacterium]
MTTTTTSLPAGVAQEAIPGVYARVARVYDLWAAATESRARARTLELAGIRDGERILEIAVGTGGTFAEVVRRIPGGTNTGIDLTPEMLARARAKAEATGVPHTLEVGDATALSFADGAFDLVLNAYMFDLLPEGDFARVLGEMRRVLRPGGRLVLTNMARGRHLRHRVYELVYRLRPELLGGCRGVELRPHLQAAGFRVDHEEYLSQLGFPTEILVATRA